MEERQRAAWEVGAALPAVGAAAASPGVQRVRVAIVGVGFSRVGLAIGLKRADDGGGTWRDNTYSGCACDVPSDLYSFSFAPNPDWTRRFRPADYLLTPRGGHARPR